MKPIFLTASLLITAIFSNLGRQPEVLTAGDSAAPVSTHSVQDDKERAFMPARRVLEAARVSFDPGILLKDDWRERITAVSARIPEMRTNLRVAKAISGFVAADTLVLPAKVTLTGDTVILARTIVYEGYNTTITGRGKNVYVFNIDAGFHTLKTFDETMADRGVARNSYPAIGERTTEPFEFRDRRSGIVKIVTDGLGYDDWLKALPKGRILPGVVASVIECPPQTPVCNGADQTGEGPMGPAVDTTAQSPPAADNPVNGYCGTEVSVNGHVGTVGDPGARGPDNPYPGGIGPKGGNAGIVQYRIPPGSDGIFIFQAIGGKGGKGGRGNLGGTGGNGQNGPKGGDGVDCTCARGGAGDGADGNRGGLGGKGGKGGRGGEGGPGGDGGNIFVEIPAGFPTTRIATTFRGGIRGDGGEGGTGGFPGNPGAPGGKGKGATHWNCPTDDTHDGMDAPGQTTLGYGDHGDIGPVGQPGVDGAYYPTVLPPPGGECERPSGPGTRVSKVGANRSEDLFAATSKGEPSQYQDPYCCNSEEASQCTLNGGEWDDATCTCVSPIIVDVLGNGFDLTDAAGGVLFDILNQGVQRQVSWTAPASDDAFLALDRNNNGLIDKGKELFGSSTPQPRLSPGETKNGFRALAVYDNYGRGGNNDGKISRLDSVYDKLLLWQDVNHNGVSDGGELFHLEEIGLKSIDLDYTEHRRHDDHGNWFRFRSKVRDTQDAQLGRWAWDVFLQVQ